MKLSVLMCLLLFIGCQSSKVDSNNKEAVSDLKRLDCDKEICLQLLNHNKDKQSFDVYLKNTYPLIDFYKKLSSSDVVNCAYLELNGMGSASDVWQSIQEAFHSAS